MNYIKKLEHTQAILNTRIAETRGRIQAFEEYLLSEKFHCGDPLDGYVNVQDVLAFLNLIDDPLWRGTDPEEEPKA